MVSKEMAKRILKVCEEIEECKLALRILGKNKKHEESILSVYKTENCEGIHLSVSHSHAVSIIGQLLEELSKEYKVLNNIAINE